MNDPLFNSNSANSNFIILTIVSVSLQILYRKYLNKIPHYENLMMDYVSATQNQLMRKMTGPEKQVCKTVTQFLEIRHTVGGN